MRARSLFAKACSVFTPSTAIQFYEPPRYLLLFRVPLPSDPLLRLPSLRRISRFSRCLFLRSGFLRRLLITRSECTLGTSSRSKRSHSLRLLSLRPREIASALRRRKCDRITKWQAETISGRGSTKAHFSVALDRSNKLYRRRNANEKRQRS